LTGLVTGTIDGRPLTMEERLGVVTVLLLGGLDTTRGAIANIAYHLATDQSIEARLRDPDWVKGDMDEFLRYESTVSFMARTLTEDVEVGGCPLKAGDRIAVHYQSANRDPRKFPNAERLDFTRQSNPHVAFGIGVHRCLGLNFARMQLRIAFDELLKQITNVKLKPGAEIVRSVGVSAGAPERMEITFDKV
jgi:cytochrome P450